MDGDGIEDRDGAGGADGDWVWAGNEDRDGVGDGNGASSHPMQIATSMPFPVCSCNSLGGVCEPVLLPKPFCKRNSQDFLAPLLVR